MATVKRPGVPARPSGSDTPTNKPKLSLKARNAAGKQARSAPRVGWRRPTGVNTEADEAAAFERHHRAEMEEEGRKHTAVEPESALDRSAEELEDEQKVTGIDWDERRKKKSNQRDDEDEDGEAAAQAAQAAAEKGFAAKDGTGKYFQDAPADRMGDLSLTDPNEMKRLLGPTVRFAQHAMLLAQSQMDGGATRSDAIRFLAELYLGLGDRAYANKALREFGPATGILDVYPLEVMNHLLQFVPGFCNKVKQGTFCTSSTGAYRAKVGEPISLEYEPSLRIRGFAIRGGARPGYVLEPVEPPGHYALTFLSEGRFDVMISAISKDGWLLVEDLVCEIEAGEAVEPVAVARERKRDGEAPVEAEPPRSKKDDLTIHFPKRI